MKKLLSAVITGGSVGKDRNHWRRDGEEIEITKRKIESLCILLIEITGNLWYNICNLGKVGTKMSYINFTNNRCEGWNIPTFHHEALEFLDEVKKNCKLYGEGITSPSKHKVIEYKYTDGTLFKFIIIPEDNTILSVYGKYEEDNGFSIIYSWC